MTIKVQALVAMSCCAVILLSCTSSKDISGTYHTNFVSVVLATTVRLKPDSTLQMVEYGDLMYDSTTGHYQIRNDKVYITFDKQKQDPDKQFYRFDGYAIKTDTIDGTLIKYQNQLYIGHHKLYFAHIETGKKVTTARYYHHRNRHATNGRWIHKKWYLKKIGK